jgi:hypothetical protein
MPAPTNVPRIVNKPPVESFLSTCTPPKTAARRISANWTPRCEYRIHAGGPLSSTAIGFLVPSSRRTGRLD